MYISVVIEFIPSTEETVVKARCIVSSYYVYIMIKIKLQRLCNLATYVKFMISI